MPIPIRAPQILRSLLAHPIQRQIKEFVGNEENGYEGALIEIKNFYRLLLTPMSRQRILNSILHLNENSEYNKFQTEALCLLGGEEIKKIKIYMSEMVSLDAMLFTIENSCPGVEKIVITNHMCIIQLEETIEELKKFSQLKELTIKVQEGPYQTIWEIIRMRMITHLTINIEPYEAPPEILEIMERDYVETIEGGSFGTLCIPEWLGHSEE